MTFLASSFYFFLIYQSHFSRPITTIVPPIRLCGGAPHLSSCSILVQFSSIFYYSFPLYRHTKAHFSFYGIKYGVCYANDFSYSSISYRVHPWTVALFIKNPFKSLKSIHMENCCTSMLWLKLILLIIYIIHFLFQMYIY